MDFWWGLRAAHLKGAPKVGPTRAHLGVPTRAIKGGEEGGTPSSAALAAAQLAPSSLSLSAARPPVRLDFMEVLRLLHKDELFVRRFTQLHV